MRDVVLDSYAVTLYTFLALEEGRRLDRLLEEGDRLSLGGLVSVAFNQPQKLGDLERRYRAKLQGKMPREDLMRLAAKVLSAEAKGLAKLKRTKPRRR